MDFEKEIKVTSTIDIIKKKAVVVKNLEEEIVDITTDDSLLEEMVNEGMTFEIYCKEQLTILAKYSEKVKKKNHQKYEDKSRNVKLPKLEIKKFSGVPTAWITFIDSFEATVDHSTHLSEKRPSADYIRYADNECTLQEGFRVAENSIRESTKNHIDAYK